jgi:choline transport protein
MTCLASMSAIASQICVEMYAINHSDYVYQKWHVFIGYLIITWGCCAVVLFGNRFLPMINSFGLFFILGGVFVTVLVCAIMPSTNGRGHAPSSAVWTEWINDTGYTSNGFVFCAGMLNGAFSIGTPDCVSHLAEEIPK